MIAADLLPLVRVLARAHAGLDDGTAHTVAADALDALPSDRELHALASEELHRAHYSALHAWAPPGTLLGRCRERPDWAARLLARIRDEWARPTPDGDVGNIISEIPTP